MKKILAWLLLAVLCAGLLSGCHGAQKRTAFEVPEKLDESKDIEITFWAKNDTNKSQVDTYQRAIDEFCALYPSVSVKMRLYTDYSRIYNDVITNIATGTTPNVCITYPDHIATYLTGENTVTPLDALVRDGRFGLGGSELRFDGPGQGEVIGKFLEECRIGGSLYALPYMRSTEACYINKSYVEKLGFELPDVLTWDFIFEVSRAAVEKDENGLYIVNGQNVMRPFIYKSTDNMMITMLRQLNAGYSDDRGSVLLFNETTTGILEEIAENAALGAFSTFTIDGYPANFLNAGRCIFAVDSTAGATWMGPEAPLSDISEDSIVDFEVAVRPVPQYDTENPLMISQGPSVCVFNKQDPQEVLVSWLFAQYLLTDGVQIAYAQTEGYVPVTSKAQENPLYLAYLDDPAQYWVKIAATRLLLENTDDTFVTPVFNGSASLRSAAGALIENVTKARRRHKDVNRETIDALYKEMTSLYRLDGGNSVAPDTTQELGPLPKGSAALLAAIVAAWLGIGIYRFATRSRKEE